MLVVAIGSPRHALGAAALGASLAALAVIGFAIRLERRLTSLASYTLNRVAGTALSLVGGYWLADGSHLSAGLIGAVLTAPMVLAGIAWARWYQLRTPVRAPD